LARGLGDRHRALPRRHEGVGVPRRRRPHRGLDPVAAARGGGIVPRDAQRREKSRKRALTVRTQAEKARAFRALHERPGLFIMQNPWDAGTAKLFASLGFAALATTSLGMASALGKVDGTLSVTRDELIENCRAIASATDLPVNADL